MSTIPVEHDETLSLILRCRTLTQYLGIDETVAIILNEGVDEESARLCATAGEMAAAWHSLLLVHSLRENESQHGMCYHERARDSDSRVSARGLLPRSNDPCNLSC